MAYSYWLRFPLLEGTWWILHFCRLFSGEVKSINVDWIHFVIQNTTWILYTDETYNPDGTLIQLKSSNLSGQRFRKFDIRLLQFIYKESQQIKMEVCYWLDKQGVGGCELTKLGAWVGRRGSMRRLWINTKAQYRRWIQMPCNDLIWEWWECETTLIKIEWGPIRCIACTNVVSCHRGNLDRWMAIASKMRLPDILGSLINFQSPWKTMELMFAMEKRSPHWKLSICINLKFAIVMQIKYNKYTVVDPHLYVTIAFFRVAVTGIAMWLKLNLVKKHQSPTHSLRLELNCTKRHCILRPRGSFLWCYIGLA